MQNRWRGRLVLPKFILASILVIVALFGLHQEAIAGVTGKIIGIVTDATTGEALPAANILITGTEMGAAADETGYYLILNVSPGIYSLESRVMGYTSVIKTGVEVIADHTTPVNFELEPTVIVGEGITVTAKREVIKMDVSSSIITAKSEDITAIPLVTDVGQFINMQEGVDDWEIRGGGMDQTAFMTDGLMLVDNRSNSMLMMPNLSTIKELNIIKGGFNAEYGNVRSGVINVITKDAPTDAYHGSINARYIPAHYKHRGPSVFDWKSYMLRPYLDTTTLSNGMNVAFDGYAAWIDEYGEDAAADTIDQYYSESWVGWTEYAAGAGMTPEEARDLFIWLHNAEGADELAEAMGYDGPSRDRSYGDKPDYKLDVSFGGPFPGLGEKLAFLASYSTDYQMFGLPVTQDHEYWHDWNASLKLTSRLTRDIKFSLEGMMETIYTVAASMNGEGNNDAALHGGVDVYGRGDPCGPMWDGDDVFSAQYANYEQDILELYYPAALAPYNIYKKMFGFSMDHVLSENIFYTLRVTYINSENENNAYMGTKNVEGISERDLTKKWTLPGPTGIQVGEEPFGYMVELGPLEMVEGSWYGAHCAGAVDTSWTKTINVKFDLTAQIDRYNEIKTGFDFNRDDMYEFAQKNRWESTWENWELEWNHQPIRMGAYIQDKLEFQGFIANIGLRMDYNNPNCEWPVLDRYSYYLEAFYKDTLRSDNPPPEIMEPAEKQIQFSPRLGISHPITENAKLYFNYGHFYSMPSSITMYRQHWGKASDPVGFLGNPSAAMPRTVAYELGVDFNIGELFRLHVAGYYKDVDRQTDWVWYTNYDVTVDYATVENNWYEDIRGFEFKFEKRLGRYVRGWINYDYMVATEGRVGRNHYYEDRVLQTFEGLHDPFQEKPLPQPKMNANIRFLTPEDWGPALGGFDLSFFYEWEAGWYMTWDPIQPDNPRFYMNLQWQPWRTLDARLSKSINFAGTNLILFAEVQNLLDWKYLSTEGFEDDRDQQDYLKSLKLPLYNEPGFEAYEGGNDKVGDLKSDSKPYINNPNIEFLAFHHTRSFALGLSFEF
jgi:outer membrane receptor protein involved in Fe transport